MQRHCGTQRRTGITCRRASDLLPRYVDGELAGRDLADLLQHLQDCAACREQLELNRNLAEMLAGLPMPADAAVAEARIAGGVAMRLQGAQRWGVFWRVARSLGNAVAWVGVGAIAVLLVWGLTVSWKPLMEARFGTPTATPEATATATPTASPTTTALPTAGATPRGAMTPAPVAVVPPTAQQATPTARPTAQPAPTALPGSRREAQPAVQGVVVTSDQPVILYAVIASRLYRSADQGRSWLEEDGSGLPLGVPLDGVAIDYRHADTIYVLTAQGIYRREGQGAWGLVNTLQAVSLAVDLQDSNTLWAGVRRNELGAVILKSADGGRTWGKADWGLPAQADVAGDILVDPRNPNILWAVVHRSDEGRSSIWRGGRDGSWERLGLGPFQPSGQGRGVTGLAYDPSANLLYAGILLGGDDRAAPASLLLRSPNADAADARTVRWEEAGRFPSSSGEARPLAVDAREPKSLFVALASPEVGPRLLVSHDGGATWDALALDSLTPRRPATPGRIAFAQGVRDPDCAAPSCGKSHIFAMNADGSDVVDLTPQLAGLAEDPAGSPDGRYIAFLSDHEAGRDANNIYIMRADGSGLTRISDRSFFQSYGPLFWSRDGQRVALRYPGDGQYYIYSVAGDALGTLGELAPDTWAWPNRSPDGRYRAEYEVANPARPWLVDLYLYADDGTKVNLAHRPFERPRQLPSWSPDGRSIVFSYGNAGIYAVSADGSAWLKLGDGSAPSWLRGP